VLAIDTGTSYLHGRALLAAIRSVTEQPVRLALITHTRQEFLFGAAAFREQGIPIAMQQAAAELMATRCDTCLKTLRTTLGEDAMRGTTMFTPDITFADPLGIDAAALIGRPIQVLYFGHSSGPGDIAVYDPRTRTLFAGGLLDAQRIPDVFDSDLAALGRGPAHAAGLAGRGDRAGPRAVRLEAHHHAGRALPGSTDDTRARAAEGRRAAERGARFDRTA
jgi:glyoxylase-like metal-dependent hydrolase (beta-lactamase superfamily II)